MFVFEMGEGGVEYLLRGIHHSKMYLSFTQNRWYYSYMGSTNMFTLKYGIYNIVSTLIWVLHLY